MDMNRDKLPPPSRGGGGGARWNNQFESTNYSFYANFNYGSTGPKPHPYYKWRRGFHRSTPYQGRQRKRNRTVNKPPQRVEEESEEEEKKKKLIDAANKLLIKIKTWSAEKNSSEESNNQENVTEQVSSFKDKNNEVSSCINENNIVGQGRRELESEKNEEGKRRIAHSKRKAQTLKNKSPKVAKNRVKSDRYDVNKRTVKDFQNRIQHKLINEIMQMPKENLQNVLNDPKINPIMELKMSRLVKENKHLIAQKLRVLAECKMKASGSISNPQLLVDIDKLIDPVIETDLSVLPYELIKQMENIFQVQFDYSDSQANKGPEIVELSDPSGVGDPQMMLDYLANNFVDDCFPDDVMFLKEEIPILKNNFSDEGVEVIDCVTDEEEEIDQQSCPAMNQGGEPESSELHHREVEEINQQSCSTMNQGGKPGSSKPYHREVEEIDRQSCSAMNQGGKPGSSKPYHREVEENDRQSCPAVNQGGKPESSKAYHREVEEINQQSCPAVNQAGEPESSELHHREVEEIDRQGCSTMNQGGKPGSSKPHPREVEEIDRQSCSAMNQGGKPGSSKPHPREVEEINQQSCSAMNQGGKPGSSKPHHRDGEENVQSFTKRRRVTNSELFKKAQQKNHNRIHFSPHSNNFNKVKNYILEDLDGSPLVDAPPTPFKRSSQEPANNLESQKEYCSRSVQTDVSTKAAETQTVNLTDEPILLYGAPVPKISADNTPRSLLQEVNSIQNLINTLNERRFNIFVNLTRGNSSFLYDNFTRDNFIETIANGSLYLLDFLRQMPQLRTYDPDPMTTYQPRKSKKKKRKNKSKASTNNNNNNNNNGNNSNVEQRSLV